MDTIYALSSGAPPAGIAVIRISGVGASVVLRALAGSLPAPRRATLRDLHDGAGGLLDQALVLWFPGPGTATGEDLAELHLHGGRAVVAAVKSSLAAMADLREAEPGEFTRRAFLNGRIDLAEAEGLADLLAAETQLQRLGALVMAGGGFSRQVEEWRDRLLGLAAQLEAVLDFSDEDDVATLPRDFAEQLDKLARELAEWLGRPQAEMLKEGYRVVLAGPPNAGKSTLFNALVGSEAAITSPEAGTTRDVIVRSVAMAGLPFSFVDTAGLREDIQSLVEQIGVGRAQDEVARADLVLWLGPEGEGPAEAWEIEAQADRPGHSIKADPAYRVSARTGAGVAGLKEALIDQARSCLPKPGEAALNARQSKLLGDARMAIREAAQLKDPLLAAEDLRRARVAFDRLVGRAATEDMLDALFGRFCIGK